MTQVIHPHSTYLDSASPSATGFMPETGSGLTSQQDQAIDQSSPLSDSSGKKVFVSTSSQFADSDFDSSDIDAQSPEDEHDTLSAPRQIKATTEETYTLWVRRLAGKSATARSTDDQQITIVSPVEIVEDFVRSADRSSWTTWRAYRAALLWHCAKHGTDPVYIEAHNLLLQAKHPKQANQSPKPKRPRASKKSKGIPEADLHALINQLGGMNGSAEWGSRTQLFLLAGIETGLRPGEWPSARWEDETKTFLLCDTAKKKADEPAFLSDPRQAIGTKAQHGGAAPAARHAPSPSETLPNLRRLKVSPTAQMYVDLHLRQIQNHPEGYEHYFRACRNKLWYACRALWGDKKSYSLYDGRHQFAANSKSKTTLEETAELMGHSRPRETMNYASRSNAHAGLGGLGPLPTQGHVEGHAALMEALEASDNATAEQAITGAGHAA